MPGTFASLFAQIDTIPTPEMNWAAAAPLLILVVPGMILLHLSALLRKTWGGFYAAYTIMTAVVAGGAAIALWDRVMDPDRGPITILANAYAVDGFSLFVTVLLCASVVLAALLIEGYQRREGLVGAEMYVLMLLSASGGVIMASANDLIVLFLGLEVLSIAVYILAAMHLRRSESQEAGMKYFVLGAFSSAFFLYGIAFVYGATGSTNLGSIAEFLASTELADTGLLLIGFAFMLVGFGFKVAAVPFHSWTPDVYEGSPSPVVAYMASGVKAAAFAGLLRVFVYAFEPFAVDWQPIVYGLAVASLFGGAVLAVVQTNVKRMMAYSSISHAGFILVGVQAATDLGTRAALFYLAAYTFMVVGTFGVITVAGRKGDAAHQLDDYRGLAQSRPVLAVCFAVFLLAQAGVPFTSGFFAKFYVITAAVEARSFWLAIAAMASAVIGAFVYLRIIVAMFMAVDPHAGSDPQPAAAAGFAPLVIPRATVAALAIALVVTVAVGVAPQTVSGWARDAIPTLLAG